MKKLKVFFVELKHIHKALNEYLYSQYLVFILQYFFLNIPFKL